MLLLMFLAVPLAKHGGWLGIAAYVALAVVTLGYSIKVEKHKKQLDIQTYKDYGDMVLVLIWEVNRQTYIGNFWVEKQNEKVPKNLLIIRELLHIIEE